MVDWSGTAPSLLADALWAILVNWAFFWQGWHWPWTPRRQEDWQYELGEMERRIGDRIDEAVLRRMTQTEESLGWERSTRLQEEAAHLDEVKRIRRQPRLWAG